MAIDQRIAGMHEEMTKWRRDIHAHSELGFEETRTAGFVAEKLETFGLVVHRGIGKTGVVGVLHAGKSTRTRIQGGSAYNVIPDSAQIAGTVRAFSRAVMEQIDAAVRRIAKGVAEGFGARVAKYTTRVTILTTARCRSA